MLTIPHNLRHLARLAAREHPRYALNGVLVQETDQGYQAIATDGHVLAIVVGPGLVDELPPADVPNGAVEALIPIGMFDRILRENRKVEVRLVLGDKQSTFLIADAASREFQSNARYAVGNVEGRYPAVASLAREQRSLFHIQVNPKLLAELLAAALPFADEDNPTVRLHFQSREKPLLVTCDNGSQQFQGAIMPLK